MSSDNGRVRSTHTLSSACEECKQRKVKCDRQRPACSICTRSGHRCEYRTRKKPGLRAGYGRELEARLQQLEDVLVAQQQILQRLTGALPDNSETAATDAITHTQRALQTPASSTSRTADPPNLNPLVEQSEQDHYFPTPAVNLPASPCPPAPPTRLHQQLRDRHVHHEGSGYTTEGTIESSSMNITSPGLIDCTATSTGDQVLLPVDLLYALTNLFLEHVNPWCPILHPSTILHSLFGPHALDEADRMILHAITAAALKFSDDHRLTDSVRRQMYASSKRTVYLYAMENVSFKILQAMTILALDIVGNSNGPPSWNILALIARNVVQLGLAVESNSSVLSPRSPSIYTLSAVVLPKPQSFSEDESRRRLFWTIYILDRFTTISTAFDFAINTKDIERRLPCHDDFIDSDKAVETAWFQDSGGLKARDIRQLHSVGSLGHYVELMGILSQIHCFLKTPLDIDARTDVEQWQKEYLSLDSRLSSWRQTLPGEYGNLSRLFNPSLYQEPVDCMWIVLQSMYFTTVIRLHSSAAFPATISSAFRPSFRASRRCLSAVDDICALCTYVTNNGLLVKLGPPFAFSIWVAARVLLVAGSAGASKLGPAIDTLVSALRQMGRHWNVADRYATLLQRVLDEYRESQLSPTAARETPASLRIVADMRRCAYDLEYMMSMQPRPQTGHGEAAQQPSHTPNTEDLMSYDTFGFFNVPRLAIPNPESAENGSTDTGVPSEARAAVDHLASPQHQANFGGQNLENVYWNDWLVHSM